jgi:hypothetical protein
MQHLKYKEQRLFDRGRVKGGAREKGERNGKVKFGVKG